MKLTLITNKKGKLLASMFGHASELTCHLGDAQHYPREGEPLATLEPQRGQFFHEIDVPDKYEELAPDELHKKLRKNYCGRKLVGKKKGKKRKDK